MSRKLKQKSLVERRQARLASNEGSTSVWRDVFITGVSAVAGFGTAAFFFVSPTDELEVGLQANAIETLLADVRTVRASISPIDRFSTRHQSENRKGDWTQNYVTTRRSQDRVAERATVLATGNAGTDFLAAYDAYMKLADASVSCVIQNNRAREMQQNSRVLDISSSTGLSTPCPHRIEVPCLIKRPETLLRALDDCHQGLAQMGYSVITRSGSFAIESCSTLPQPPAFHLPRPIPDRSD